MKVTANNAFAKRKAWRSAADTKLRDAFATAALQGYASCPRIMDRAIDDWNENGGRRPVCVADFLAGLAYEVADAMLKERAK